MKLEKKIDNAITGKMIRGECDGVLYKSGLRSEVSKIIKQHKSKKRLKKAAKLANDYHNLTEEAVKIFNDRMDMFLGGWVTEYYKPEKECKHLSLHQVGIKTPIGLNESQEIIVIYECDNCNKRFDI